MRIIINYGLVIFLVLITFITAATLKNLPLDSFTLGMLFGQMMMVGLFMLNRGIVYDTVRRKWKEY